MRENTSPLEHLSTQLPFLQNQMWGTPGPRGPLFSSSASFCLIHLQEQEQDDKTPSAHKPQSITVAEVISKAAPSHSVLSTGALLKGTNEAICSRPGQPLPLASGVRFPMHYLSHLHLQMKPVTASYSTLQSAMVPFTSKHSLHDIMIMVFKFVRDCTFEVEMFSAIKSPGDNWLSEFLYWSCAFHVHTKYMTRNPLTP